MSPSPKLQVMFASAFSGIGDFFPIFGIHTFYATATFYTPGTHALNTCGRRSRVHSARSLVIGRRASQQCGGITAGKARHNSSNVRGATAGKVRHNSSNNNSFIL